MKKRILYVASIESHLKTFHKPYLFMLKEQGYEIHTAALGENLIECVDRHYNINFTREPLSRQNILAYYELKRIIDQNEYTLIHCHTPAASVITRIAGRKARKKGTKIVYTAHGFHFYIGGPKLSCLIYHTIENQMSRFTDAILTINKEDFESAKKLRIDPQKVYLTHGVGCDSKRFFPPDSGEKVRLREEFNLPAKGFLLIYPAELNSNKNQEMILKVMPKLRTIIPEVMLLLPGTGASEFVLKDLAAELGINDNVVFLGNRNDVEKLLRAADLDVTASKREGLGMHVVEALMTGIPVVASKNRGHKELIIDGVNGLFFDLDTLEDLAAKIYEIYEISNDPTAKEDMRRACIESAMPFCLENTLKAMDYIYSNILSSGVPY